MDLSALKEAKERPVGRSFSLVFKIPVYPLGVLDATAGSLPNVCFLQMQHCWPPSISKGTCPEFLVAEEFGHVPAGES